MQPFRFYFAEMLRICIPLRQHFHGNTTREKDHERGEARDQVDAPYQQSGLLVTAKNRSAIYKKQEGLSTTPHFTELALGDVKT